MDLSVFVVAQLFLLSYAAYGNIRIIESGVRRIERLDIGMVFYVELVNEGKQEVTVASRMIGCCEIITIEDIECEHIRLIGSDADVLPLQEAKNVTLIWPNLYLHDRRGECVVAVVVKDGNAVEEMHRKILFDTTVAKKIPDVLKEYYKVSDVTKCSSVDLDSLDQCHPVNCQIKYDGKRNFFNRQRQRCQPVPVCLADLGRELPDVVYDPINNNCRNMENSVTEGEIQLLSEGKADVVWGSNTAPPKITNIVCHHGYKHKTTGFCICDNGWTSQPLGNLEPINEYIHMCNVVILPFPGFGNSPVHILLMTVLAVLIVLVTLFYCLTTMLIGMSKTTIKIERSQQTTPASYMNTSSRKLTSENSRKHPSRNLAS